MTIYYYPPPTLLLFKSISVPHVLSTFLPMFIMLCVLIFNLVSPYFPILYYLPSLVASDLCLKTREIRLIYDRGKVPSTYQTHLRVTVDCALAIPYHYLILSAIMIKPNYCQDFWRWEPALFTPLNAYRLDHNIMMMIYMLWLLSQRGWYYLFPLVTYMSDGVRTYRVV